MGLCLCCSRGMCCARASCFQSTRPHDGTTHPSATTRPKCNKPCRAVGCVVPAQVGFNLQGLTTAQHIRRLRRAHSATILVEPPDVFCRRLGLAMTTKLASSRSLVRRARHIPRLEYRRKLRKATHCIQALVSTDILLGQGRVVDESLAWT